MKKWNELTPVQQSRITAFFVYCFSDQMWIDMLEDGPEWCAIGLRKHGYNPDLMTTEEQLQALKNIDDDEDW